VACEAPPRWVVHLREPGSEEGQAPPAGSGPAHLFSLSFSLPRNYPAAAAPVIGIIGPLGGWRAARVHGEYWCVLNMPVCA
jgi:hypothetical protein